MLSLILGILAVWFIVGILAACAFVHVLPRDPDEPLDLTGHRWRS